MNAGDDRSHASQTSLASAPAAGTKGRSRPMPSRSFQLVGILCAIGTIVGWSVTPVLIGSLVDHIDAWTSNGWRYTLAALTWLPFLLIARKRGKWPAGLMKKAIIPAGINAIAQSMFTSAFYLIDPTLLVIALRFQIVAVAIGAAIMFAGERRVIRTPMFLVGATLATLGIIGVLVLKLVEKGAGDSTHLVAGVLLAMASGAGFGGYALAVRKCMRGISSPLAFAAISQYTCLVMLVMMVTLSPTRGMAVPSLSGGLLLILLISTYTGIAGTHVLYYIAIQRIGVAVSTAVLQLQPLGVGIIAYFALGEVLTIPQWACGLVAIAGASMTIWVQHTMREKPGIPPFKAPPEEFAELPIDAVVASVIDERETPAKNTAGTAR